MASNFGNPNLPNTRFIFVAMNLVFYLFIDPSFSIILKAPLKINLKIRIITHTCIENQHKTIWSNGINLTTLVANMDKLFCRLFPWRGHNLGFWATIINNFLNPRSLGFQLNVVWSNVTNNSTVVACRNKLG
jgi:hypothetical protein